jgi:uncharacterized surface protein with fasciclin (FAS1) repeats
MNKPMKFRSTMLAAAVALACGGGAVAGENEAGNMDTQTSDRYQTQSEEYQTQTDQTQPDSTSQYESTTESTDRYDNQDEPYGDEMGAEQDMTRDEGQEWSQDQESTVAPDPAQDQQWNQDQESTVDQSADPAQDQQWTPEQDPTATQDNTVPPTPSQAQDQGVDQAQDQQWNQDQNSMANQGQSEQGKGEEVFTDQFAEENDLGEFVKAVKTAGLGDALTDGTQYTIFAPTDEAFTKFKEEKGEDWSSEQNVDELTKVLRSHIVVGDLDRQRLETLDSAQVLTGSVVEISSENGELKIGDAKVVEDEIMSSADNITIYTIDGVIDPSSLSERSASATTSTSEQQDSQPMATDQQSSFDQNQESTDQNSDTQYQEELEEDEPAE